MRKLTLEWPYHLIEDIVRQELAETYVDASMEIERFEQLKHQRTLSDAEYADYNYYIRLQVDVRATLGYYSSEQQFDEIMKNVADRISDHERE